MSWTQKCRGFHLFLFVCQSRKPVTKHFFSLKVKDTISLTQKRNFREINLEQSAQYSLRSGKVQTFCVMGNTESLVINDQECPDRSSGCLDMALCGSNNSNRRLSWREKKLFLQMYSSNGILNVVIWAPPLLLQIQKEE